MNKHNNNNNNNNTLDPSFKINEYAQQADGEVSGVTSCFAGNALKKIAPLE